MSGDPEESTSNGAYYRLMLYAALFGGLFSLITTGYITLYNEGVKFFGQHSVYLFKINFWPLILLGVSGVFIGLAIKFLGQHGGPGVAQAQYARTGGINYRNLPGILIQGFIALWSGAAVGPGRHLGRALYRQHGYRLPGRDDGQLCLRLWRAVGLGRGRALYLHPAAAQGPLGRSCRPEALRS